ncbi:MAG: amidohydrolase family protein [Verrucomicrobiales bacterium]
MSRRFANPALLLPAFLVAAPTIGAESLLLSGATVHTVSGETVSPGQVLIKDGKIAAVGASVEVNGAKVIDLKGQHLYPGLIAADSTLGLSEISAVRATRDDTEVGQYTPDVRAWMAVNPDSELIPVSRANGITHANVIPHGGIVAGQSGIVKLEGWTIEDMTTKSPSGLHVFWPGMELDTRSKEEWKDKSKWRSLADQAKERRAKVKELAEFFLEAKAYAKAKGSAADGKFETVPAWEAMLPFVRGEIPLVVHADELRQIRAALILAETNGYRMVLVGGRDAGELADQIARLHVPVVFDSVFTLPPQDSTGYDVQFKVPLRLHKAGIKIAFSEDGRFGASSLRNLPYVASQAVAFGLPREIALKGITLFPAEILGVHDRLGSIEPGKEASLIAVDGDILDLRSNVKRMWISGNEVSLESRHTRLYEKFRQRPKK